jgi:superfamily I DNA/RNA helicase
MYFSDQIAKIPRAMQRLQQSTGIHMNRMTELMSDCVAMTKVIYSDLRAVRHTIEYQRVHVEQFLPFNSKNSVLATFKVSDDYKNILSIILIIFKKKFQNDARYYHRKAAISVYLTDKVSWAFFFSPS